MMIVSVQLIAWAALVAILVSEYRWMRQRSRVFAVWFACGLIGRALIGAALFLISFWQLPIMPSLQLGGGFWALALDGRTYFDLAAHAAATTIRGITDDFPSPFYLRTLAVWLRVFGAVPPSAIVFNLTCYACTAALVLIAAQRGDRRTDSGAATLALAGLTICPSLVLFGTQPLKDPLSATLVVAVVAGFRLWSADVTANVGISRKLAGLVLMSIGVYAMAGIRAYFAGFMIAGIAAATAWIAASSAQRSARLRTLALNVPLLVVLWMMFAAGGGPYYRDYMRFARNTVFGPDSAIGALDTARAGFIATGGGTSFAPIPSADDRVEGFERRARGPGWAGRLHATVTGCLMIMVPVSILRALSIVTFSGGRGLLMITDLDTLVIDLTVLACILWTMTSRRERRLLDPAVLFAAVLAATTFLALAYVVTNFGTLFRLRLLVAPPLWLIPVLRVRSGEAISSVTSASGRVP
jgi:hypothetical protein